MLIDTGPSVFPTQVNTLDVPPGNYIVSASGTITQSGQETSNWADCALDPGSGATVNLIVGSDDTHYGYALDGLISLPNGGTIALDCTSPTSDEGFGPILYDNNMVASKVDAIN